MTVLPVLTGGGRKKIKEFKGSLSYLTHSLKQHQSTKQTKRKGIITGDQGGVVEVGGCLLCVVGVWLTW